MARGSRGVQRDEKVVRRILQADHRRLHQASCLGEAMALRAAGHRCMVDRTGDGIKHMFMPGSGMADAVEAWHARGGTDAPKRGGDPTLLAAARADVSGHPWRLRIHMPDAEGLEALAKHDLALKNCGSWMGHGRPVSCMSPLCPRCGGRGGRRHLETLKRIAKKIDLDSLKSILVLGLSVPLYLRRSVASRKGIEAFFGAAQRFVGLYWSAPSGRMPACAATLHLHVRDHDLEGGEPEERRRDVHPHLHVLLFGPRRRGRAVPYAAMREAWAEELSRAYGVDAHVPYDGGPASVNIFLRDVKNRAEFEEAVRYHTRLADSSHIAAYDDAFLLNFKFLTVVGLHRFQWTRLWNLNCSERKGVLASENSGIA